MSAIKVLLCCAVLLFALILHLCLWLLSRRTPLKISVISALTTVCLSLLLYEADGLYGYYRLTDQALVTLIEWLELQGAPLNLQQVEQLILLQGISWVFPEEVIKLAATLAGIKLLETYYPRAVSSFGVVQLSCAACFAFAAYEDVSRVIGAKDLVLCGVVVETAEEFAATMAFDRSLSFWLHAGVSMPWIIVLSAYYRRWTAWHCCVLGLALSAATYIHGWLNSLVLFHNAFFVLKCLLALLLVLQLRRTMLR